MCARYIACFRSYKSVEVVVAAGAVLLGIPLLCYKSRVMNIQEIAGKGFRFNSTTFDSALLKQDLPFYEIANAL